MVSLLAQINVTEEDVLNAPKELAEPTLPSKALVISIELLVAFIVIFLSSFILRLFLTKIIKKTMLVNLISVGIPLFFIEYVFVWKEFSYLSDPHISDYLPYFVVLFPAVVIFFVYRYLETHSLRLKFTK